MTRLARGIRAALRPSWVLPLVFLLILGASCDRFRASSWDARADLILRLGVEEEVARAPLLWGPAFGTKGVKARWVSWPVMGDRAQALVLVPDPAPSGPRPLFFHFAGHWGGGAESEEMLPGGALLAAAGHVTVLLPLRGEERGADGEFHWRASHFSSGAWADSRVRRAGRTPVGWDVDAARALLPALMAGEAGLPIDPDRVDVMGFSGGAERAIAWSIVQGGVRTLIVGAFELAFGTQDGMAFCACGAVAGAEDDIDGEARLTRWLRAIRAGRVLLYAGAGSGRIAEPIRRALPAEILPEQGHGLGIDEHRRVLDLLDGRAAPPVPALDVPRHARLDWPQGDLGPGAAEEARVLDRLQPPSPAEISALLGLRGEEDPRVGAPMGGPPELTTVAPTEGGASRAWLVVVPRTPRPGLVSEERPVPYDEVWPVDLEDPAAFVGLDPTAHWAFLRPGLAGGHGDDLRATRRFLERGPAPLALVVADIRETRRRVEAAEHLLPGSVGLVGIGAAGVAVLVATALDGDRAPIVLIDAPATLRSAEPGPSSGRSAELRLLPWPLWTLVPIAGGLRLDPAVLSRPLGSRLSWFRPRDGQGGAWTGPPPGGAVYSDVTAIFRGTTPGATP